VAQTLIDPQARRYFILRMAKNRLGTRLGGAASLLDPNHKETSCLTSRLDLRLPAHDSSMCFVHTMYHHVYVPPALRGILVGAPHCAAALETVYISN